MIFFIVHACIILGDFTWVYMPVLFWVIVFGVHACVILAYMFLTSIRFQNTLSRVEVTAQLKRPGIGRNASCASELLDFETLPS